MPTSAVLFSKEPKDLLSTYPMSGTNYISVHVTTIFQFILQPQVLPQYISLTICQFKNKKSKTCLKTILSYVLHQVYGELKISRCTEDLKL